MGDNYYRKYPGDYRRDTAHLSVTEHGAYNLLMDVYYATGRPLPESVAALVRMVGCQSKLERAAVARVAEEFFPVNGDGMRHNKRADKEIAEREAFNAKQARKSALGVTARLTKRSIPEQPVGQPAGEPTGQPVGHARVDHRLTPPSPSPSPTPSREQTTTKNSLSVVKPTDAAVRVSEFMLATIKARVPTLRQPNMAAWARDCDRMLRLDGRDELEAQELITWVASDPFWQANILCPAKLREKWDQLQAKRGTLSVPAEQRDRYEHLEEK